MSSEIDRKEWGDDNEFGMMENSEETATLMSNNRKLSQKPLFLANKSKCFYRIEYITYNGMVTHFEQHTPLNGMCARFFWMLSRYRIQYTTKTNSCNSLFNDVIYPKQTSNGASFSKIIHVLRVAVDGIDFFLDQVHKVSISIAYPDADLLRILTLQQIIPKIPMT